MKASAILLSVLPLAAASKAEFIYDRAPFPSCHASTIVEIAPGELYAAWFGGTDEGEKDVAIWGARRKDGAWSAPVELVREANVPTWNPVLFFTPGKTLWLYYKFGPSPQTWTAGRLSSQDGGRSWTARQHLPAGVLGPIRNKPLLLDDGTILSGTSVESYASWAVWVERSTDGGRTWTKHGPVTFEDTPNLFPAPAAYGLIQPAIVKLPDRKTLRMYVRATPQIGRVCYSDSTDGGRTWTAAKALSLAHPNSGIAAVNLRDGRIVLVYNNTPKGRTPLNVAISKDGAAFTDFYTLESQPGEYSYPAIIEDAAGNLHITYTWKRQKIRYVEIRKADLPK